MRAKPHDIQWPVASKTVENINTNFDALFRGLNDLESSVLALSSAGLHEILSFTHTDSVKANRIRGDILTAQGAPPKWSRLAKGTLAYVLTMNATDPVWADPAHALLSATHSDALAAAVVRGDVIIGNATPKWSRLAKGTSGYVLTAGASDVSWANPAHVLLSATHTDTLAGTVVRGDLVVGNATPKWSRLPAGTATYILTMGATDPAWAAPVVQTSALLSAVHTDTTAAAVVRGDLIAGIGATPKWERVAAGTLNYVLTMGATEPAWAAIPTQTSKLLSTTHTDTLADDVVRGDLIVGNATPKWARLAKGTAGYVLTMGADDPAWTDLTAAIAHNLLSATHPDTLTHPAVRGDLIVGDNSVPCLWSAFPVGAVGSVLYSDGTDPSWKLLSTIASTALSDTANIAYVNVSNTFTLNQQITVAGSAWLWVKATTNNVVQLALQRDEPAGSYNITWNAYIPASSTDFRIQGGGSDWLTLTSAGLLTIAGFGTHLFSAGGTGANILSVANTTSGVGNYAQLTVIAGTSVTTFYSLSQGFTTTGIFRQSGGVLLTDGAGGLTICAQAADIWFYANNIFTMVLDHHQNVGIGAPTPGAKLDVNGEIVNSSTANSTPYTQSRIAVYRDASNWGVFAYGSDAQMRVIYSRTASAKPLLFGSSSAFDGTGTFTETMRISGAGYVGIGTDAPQVKLDVIGPAETTAYIVGRFGSATEADGVFLQFTDSNTYNFAIGTVPTSGDFAFYSARYPGAAGTERMRIMQGGNVGIGTATPAAMLDVKNTIRAMSNTEVSPGSGKGIELLYNSAADAGYLVSYDRSGPAYKALKILAASIMLVGPGAFVASDKYVVIDASGNLHVSALGPAS